MDALFVASLALATCYFNDPVWMAGPMHFSKEFLDHYTPVHDYINNPMNPTLATLIFLTDIYFVLKTYVLEKPVVDVAHKKYTSLGTYLSMAAHGIGSMSGAIMTPKVFGVKDLTVPGFTLMGVVRLLDVARVLTVDHRLVPNLWIMLQVGTLVQLLGHFVLPYSSKGGREAVCSLSL
ncbi:hypothetical protein TL16_g01424 [Triparma laevis f. inornata]|uniref:Uncharacterized protein n=1 Tax=Triparma laevis f. inornata TaxID=1714386 RepID=A0A9W6ZL72_9STRA|nr:hypothetical protein TL16_g01424 [Triparma laevis f. inornata]